LRRVPRSKVFNNEINDEMFVLELCLGTKPAGLSLKDKKPRLDYLENSRTPFSRQPEIVPSFLLIPGFILPVEEASKVSQSRLERPKRKPFILFSFRYFLSHRSFRLAIGSYGVGRTVHPVTPREMSCNPGCKPSARRRGSFF